MGIKNGQKNSDVFYERPLWSNFGSNQRSKCDCNNSIGQDRKSFAMNRTAGYKLAVKKLTCRVGVKLTSVKADSGIVFEPLQPVADRNVLFCEELIPVFLLLIKSDIIDSSLETYSLKDFNGKVLICCQETIVITKAHNILGHIFSYIGSKSFHFS